MLDESLCRKDVPGLDEAITADEYAAISGMSFSQVVEKIRAQNLLGVCYEGTWYVEAPPECERALRELKGLDSGAPQKKDDPAVDPTMESMTYAYNVFMKMTFGGFGDMQEILKAHLGLFARRLSPVDQVMFSRWAGLSDEEWTDRHTDMFGLAGIHYFSGLRKKRQPIPQILDTLLTKKMARHLPRLPAPLTPEVCSIFGPSGPLSSLWMDTVGF